mmetsp:Transcript_10989/g.25093  ORF Transcript_10989/g.25093 Transcript_10989/m.25093 type:complete len:505 (+) Transcript_10989:137-1651(+)
MASSAPVALKAHVLNSSHSGLEDVVAVTFNPDRVSHQSKIAFATARSWREVATQFAEINRRPVQGPCIDLVQSSMGLRDYGAQLAEVNCRKHAGCKAIGLGVTEAAQQKAADLALAITIARRHSRTPDFMLPALDLINFFKSVGFIELNEDHVCSQRLPKPPSGPPPPEALASSSSASSVTESAPRSAAWTERSRSRSRGSSPRRHRSSRASKRPMEPKAPPTPPPDHLRPAASSRAPRPPAAQDDSQMVMTSLFMREAIRNARDAGCVCEMSLTENADGRKVSARLLPPQHPALPGVDFGDPSSGSFAAASYGLEQAAPPPLAIGPGDDEGPQEAGEESVGADAKVVELPNFCYEEAWGREGDDAAKGGHEDEADEDIRVEVVEIDNIAHSQRTYKDRFQDGKRLGDLISGLRSGRIRPDADFLHLEAYRVGPTYVSSDNRRLYCLRKAGVKHVYLKVVGQFASKVHLDKSFRNYDPPSGPSLRYEGRLRRGRRSDRTRGGRR